MFKSFFFVLKHDWQKSLLNLQIKHNLKFNIRFKINKNFSGLSNLAASSGITTSRIRLFYTSRHILAIVCGLGMGIIPAIFLLLNLIADSTHDGSVGLPIALSNVCFFFINF